MNDAGTETFALLKLSMCEGVGNAAIHRLIAEFGSATVGASGGRT